MEPYLLLLMPIPSGQMIDGVSVGKSGYGFILDKDGKIIAHKSRDRVNEEVNYIEMAKSDPSYTSVAEQNKDMMAGKNRDNNGYF